ncbi:MAG: inositol monophosphatase [Candidatus Marinimicrobia bacterium]|nr:inositol monophosphatase [Candidatus Neomarinimicrobiota bacterium]
MLSDILLINIFQTAIVAAQSAGQFIMENVDKAIEINFKGRANVVTDVDRGAEEIIISMVRESFPDHQILAEETPAINTSSPFKWIIDPLDGTTNFIHGFPAFAVSIAVEYNSDVIIGVVYDPVRKELFSAIKNRGAFLNRNQIKVSNIKTLSESLLATGFPYELQGNFNLNMDIFREMYQNSQGVRRVGSAALDLCYTACGRFDGFWEFDLNPWDVAAGALIVSEAGGKLSDFSGKDFSIYGKQVLATNGLIELEMLFNLAQVHK